MQHPRLDPHLPHLRSEHGWELCDEAPPCEHATRARADRRFRTIAGTVLGGVVAFVTACSCGMVAEVTPIAGTFFVATVLATIVHGGLCSSRPLLDTPVVDGT